MILLLIVIKLYGFVKMCELLILLNFYFEINVLLFIIHSNIFNCILIIAKFLSPGF